MSLTVTFSRSRMPRSISWRLPGSSCPASRTTLRSSSVDRLSDERWRGSMPNRRNKPLLIAPVSQTTGLSGAISSKIRRLEGKAISSGRRAANVFGVISPKIRMIIVRAVVAITTPASPQSSTATTVAIEAARILTTLLPTRIVPSKRSGVLSKRCARCAPLCPSRPRWRSL